MPFNKGYAEKIDVMIFYDLRYQNPKKFGFRNLLIDTTESKAGRPV